MQETRLPSQTCFPGTNSPCAAEAPFIHLFRTMKQHYVYDVNTRRIIRVSPIVWDVLRGYGKSPDEDIIAIRGRVHGQEAVKGALEEVVSAQKKKGLFLPHRPEQVLPPAEEEVTRLLDTQREQLILNVTEECNFRCSYCIFSGQYKSQRTHSRSTMTWETAKAAIDDFFGHSSLTDHRVISFYGGEPLMNLPLVVKCVDYAKHAVEGQQLTFAMTTNGYLLQGQTMKFLADNNFMFMISLDGPSEVHDRHRLTADGKPTWKKVIQNLQQLLKVYPAYRTNGRLKFNAVATPDTDLRELTRFFSSSDIVSPEMSLEVSIQRKADKAIAGDRSLDILRNSLLEMHGYFCQRLSSGHASDKPQAPCNWVEASLFEKPFVFFHKRGYISPHLPPILRAITTCIPGARRVFVNTNGQYFACERVTPCAANVIGSAYEGIDTKLVLGLLNQWITATDSRCRNCWCLSICRAGCFATVQEDGEVKPEAMSQACINQQNNMHKLLIDYCTILEADPKAFDYTANYHIQ